MGSVEDEARAKAINLYKILAGVQFLLGVGLLICGGFGTVYTNEDSEEDIGPPFFLGGFLVGSALLISALLSTCIFIKGADAKDEIKAREIACGIMGQYILCMFIFMMSFMSLVFAGIGGCDTWINDGCSPERDIIRYVIIAAVVIALLLNIFNMYIVCTYGSYFGVVMNRGRRGRMVMTINTTNVATGGATGMNANNIALNNALHDSRMQQLQQQNELLQRQLQLQQQMNQYGGQTQFGGQYQPPPPPSYGFSQDAAYPPPQPAFPQPDAPPPPYSSTFK